jgi:hypothetical protein
MKRKKQRGLTLHELARTNDISAMNCPCWGCRMMRCGMCATCAHAVHTIMQSQITHLGEENEVWEITIPGGVTCCEACERGFRRWLDGRGWTNLHPELVGRTVQ